MKKEDYDSLVYSGYESALNYLSVQSNRVDAICDNLNLISGVAHIPVYASYSPISNPDLVAFPNKDLCFTAAPSSFKVNQDSLQYAEVKASIGAMYQPNLLSAIGSVQGHLDNFSNINSYLPKIDNSYAVSSMVGYAREATASFVGLSKPSTLGYLAANIEDNISPWYGENIAKLTYPVSARVDINQTSDWVESILGKQSLSKFAVQASIVKASEYSVFAEKSIWPVSNENLGSMIHLNDESKRMLSHDFGQFSYGYASLITSYDKNPLLYTHLDPSISRMVPSEYFLGANLLESISVEEDVSVEEEVLKNEIQIENEILLSTYLPRLNPGLLRMWKGAIEAYHSNNSDRVRHFSASLRELFTHLMHELAPDESIKKWSSDQKHYHNGNPTRKARLLYICRNIDSDHFHSFVDLDINATISFIDIFQKGTHEIEPSFSPNQLVSIKSKAENTLKFLLEIHYKTNN